MASATAQTTNQDAQNNQSPMLATAPVIGSALVSRNVTVLGKRTSIRLETQMWSAMKEIAEREHCSIHELCSLIAMRRKPGLSLTASIRIFLMLYFKAASSEEGHTKAGHGSLDRMVSRLMPNGNRFATVNAAQGTGQGNAMDQPRVTPEQSREELRA